MQISTFDDNEREANRLAADLAFRGIKARSNQVEYLPQTPMPEYVDIHLPLHTWRIYSKGDRQEVLSKCHLHSEDKTINIRCKICDHL